MKKIRMVVELEYDDTLMGTDEEEITWFHDKILFDKEGLILHSNEIGNEVGKITVLNILDIGEDN